MAEVLFPRAARYLICDERVRRFSVGNSEQRFGEAHQDDALVRREAILVHEGIDAGVIGFVGTRPVYETTRHVGGAAALVLGEKRPLDQRADEPRLVH